MKLFLIIMSLLLGVTAVFFLTFGLGTTYLGNTGNEVVGGDAYNYIIFATRGTSLVGAGIVCSVLSATFAIFATHISDIVNTDETSKNG